MKIFDLALKDLKCLMKKPFNLVMMFGAPFLITGLLYFAFGGMADGGENFNLQEVQVQVVNLDQSQGNMALGSTLIKFLQNEEFSKLLEIHVASNETEAREAVDSGSSDVAVIIPRNFTSSALSPGVDTAITLVQDPTLTIGPGILKEILQQFIDVFAGAKITSEVVAHQFSDRGENLPAAALQQIAMEYTGDLQFTNHEHEDASRSLIIRSPQGSNVNEKDTMGMIAPIMASMMIFFVFFMGANSAQSIIQEDEEGTLPRLFTTPTSKVYILGGKFITVFFTLILQTGILLVASSYLFDINWGQPSAVIFNALGLVVAASGFGVLLMSLIENTRQVGPILGGVLTVTGMLGGLFTNGIPNIPEVFETVNLTMPQGLALRAWKMALAGASVEELMLPVGILFLIGFLLFTLGFFIFRRRFS